MSIPHATKIAFKAENYDKEIDKLYNITSGEELYVSLAMCIVILGLAAYLVRLKRW